MFENICTLPLTSELFSQALHPTLPILSVGLSAGHVQTYKLPDPNAASSESSTSPDPQPGSIDDDVSHNGLPRRSSLRRTSSVSAASDSGLGEIETAWRTRRHKGSCRTISFSPDGSLLFSAGTDGLVKAARSEDGRVVSKIAIRPDENGDPDPPTHLHILNPHLLILATDSSAVHFHDLRLSSSTISPKPVATHHPHPSFLSSLTPLPASDTSTSGFPKQFVSTGGTTLAVTDIRRGVLVQSSDQEEELTSSVFVSGLKKGGTSRGEKVIVGGSDGVLTLWERGVWDDQDERIILDRGGEGIESLTTVPPTATTLRPQGEHKLLAAGLGDGRIKFVRLGVNKVVHEWDLRHDELEGVVALGFDVGGRLVSGGGETVKVWRESLTPLPPVVLNGSSSTTPSTAGNAKRPFSFLGGDGDDDDNGSGSDEGDVDDSEADSDSDGDASQQQQKTKRRKRKRGRGKDRSGGQQVFGSFRGV